jgi:allantoate deiminase
MAQQTGGAPATAAGGPALSATVMRRLDELARFSSDAGALTRLYLTPQHKAAALQVMAWMREAGMAASIDAVGNTVGRYEAAGGPGAPALLLGSHIDTVRNAGRYDGNLGVVVAIEAVAALHARGERLPFAVEVIAFGDEEGVRFPMTLTGSHAVAGTFDPAALATEDEDRILLGHALRAFGCDPAGIKRVARRREDVLGYVEIHIEQGPVLEAEGLPVGVVTAIKGASRFTVEVAGTAGHAGTVPMGLRRDALAAAAEMVLLVEQAASGTPDLVATVGTIEASPGAVNVIAAGARFTIDIRSPSDEMRNGAVARLREDMEAVARRRGVGLRIEKTYDEAAAVCAPALVEQLEAAIARAGGVRPRRLPSGAGHDGLAMVALCPIGMLFVRCAGGISHNPAESITTEDADTAARVLLDFLRNFRPLPH